MWSVLLTVMTIFHSGQAMVDNRPDGAGLIMPLLPRCRWGQQCHLQRGEEKTHLEIYLLLGLDLTQSDWGGCVDE